MWERYLRWLADAQAVREAAWGGGWTDKFSASLPAIHGLTIAALFNVAAGWTELARMIALVPIILGLTALIALQFDKRRLDRAKRDLVSLNADEVGVRLMRAGVMVYLSWAIGLASLLLAGLTQQVVRLAA